ncbi:indolepyruvate ferredoxin oxidoreductase family protein [Maritalea sp.]|uniref:indolepyruvate ferredoxin oxidoreductase family protein n=1 Tax=Maritalea sp. TaxID=2003361 RepID=UPI003EF1E16B
MDLLPADVNIFAFPDYELADGLVKERVFLSGTDILVRIPIEQAKSDQAAGLNTAGFISGYRGSPLGAYDQAMFRAKDALDKQNITVKPAINEDLAATALVGTQEVSSDEQVNVDGVFGIWYGKGPGVDRSGDALKHGNALGTSKNGGVLAFLGDDHGCVSSSMPHQSDQAAEHFMMPVLHPAGVADYIPFGLYGFAASRFSGAWIGIKTISEVLESSAAIEVPHPRKFNAPGDYTPPFELSHDPATSFGPVLEQKLLARLDAVKAFARANPIDRVAFGAKKPKLAIVAVGKAFADLMQTLKNLGLSEAAAKRAGIGVYKVGLVWPIEPTGYQAFLRDAEKLLVIEEKRAVVETQLKELFFNSENRFSIIGKKSLDGTPLLPEAGELRPSILAQVVHQFLDLEGTPPVPQPAPNLAGLEVERRTPYFCSGCPHNRSTNLPEGSKALPGIGCHFMASWMGRETNGIVQMGGEGVNWIGMSPYTGREHIFQNLGDGTYFHSGLLAIRQSIAANTNVTYKVLYNHAVAMTGGQDVDGELSVESLIAQLRAEGIKRIALVSDKPDRFAWDLMRGEGMSIDHRKNLDAVQEELKTLKGVTALIFDQGCATEKRRKRKRGLIEDPKKRVFINPAVCEGCGDCSVQSNCISVSPVKTKWGVKRTIDQSSCNKDFSCVEGFCPSFVTVEGDEEKATGDEAKRQHLLVQAQTLSDPKIAKTGEILITGIGGTGVVTVGAVLAMAAHLQGKGASVLDFMGFAQKGGAVISHLKILEKPGLETPVRIDKGSASALIACDLVVANMAEPMASLSTNKTSVIANTKILPTADFVLRGLADFQEEIRLQKLEASANSVTSFDVTNLSVQLFGDSVFSNMMLTGMAWQKGSIPLDGDAIRRAVVLNGKAVDANLQAFELGRLIADQPNVFQVEEDADLEQTLDELIQDRAAFLTEYQDDKYAEQYRSIVAKISVAEASIGKVGLSEIVAHQLARLMAYKDEYEVARLHLETAHLSEMRTKFKGGGKLKFHMAPPMLNWIKEPNGRPKKFAIPGAVAMPTLKMLNAMRPLRGTAFDVFGWAKDRRDERKLRGDYIQLVEELVQNLNAQNHAAAMKRAGLVETVKGYGVVKEANLGAYFKKLKELV